VVLVLVQIVRAVALWVKAILVIVGAVAVAVVVEAAVVEMVVVLSTNRVRPTLLLPFSSLKYSVLLAFNPI